MSLRHSSSTVIIYPRIQYCRVIDVLSLETSLPWGRKSKRPASGLLVIFLAFQLVFNRTVTLKEDPGKV